MIFLQHHPDRAGYKFPGRIIVRYLFSILKKLIANAAIAIISGFQFSPVIFIFEIAAPGDAADAAAVGWEMYGTGIFYF